MGERISVAALHELVAAAFQNAGVPAENASVVADVLVEAEGRGIESHGVRMLASYVARLKAGGFSASAEPKVIREGPAIALLDGENGLGPLVATRAMRVAMEKARAAGIGACAVRNSNHYGAAACYALMACREGLIGI
ncbi:MAG TPA: Ldh family oxidoreductase, partial [Chloroflexota bacterium]|nr:Ldh family oxidoreductase [Chloroflexota bacterium]